MLTDEEFRLFRNLIYEESGMYFKESRKDFLESRLMKRMQATKTATPYWYYRLVTESRKAELLAFLDHLTINETSFFRNPPQIELFENVILPGVAARKREEKRKQLRIWSAGCSTGEEPYTIAMLILENGSLHGWDIEIIGSDINQRVLTAARRGIYRKNSFRSTEPYLADKYFREEEDGVYMISDRVKQLVSFCHLNLLDPCKARFIGQVDVVFCRNVLIYFDYEARKKVVDNFYDRLSDGGYLLLGHAESLMNISTSFALVHLKHDIVYSKPANRGACVHVK